MSNFYKFYRPFLFLFSPELAHSLSIFVLKYGLLRFGRKNTHPILNTKVWNLSFPTPIGLAAGYDKNAEVPEEILKLGFGFTEVGTITPKAQPGNLKPRIFRLIKDNGVINRLGFNNGGLGPAKKRLNKINERGRRGIVGANVGANKTSDDRIEDYIIGLEALEGLADYYVINISSPNTPGLRALQSKKSLEDLLGKTIKARDGFKSWAPLLLKVAPDLTEEDIKDISEVAMDKKIDGLIIANTTILRPESLTSQERCQSGGLSGRPLFELSTKTLRSFYKSTMGKIPLIGVGGVEDGETAYKKIKSGASLVQIYSSLVYEGPNLAIKISNQLDALLIKDGYKSVAEAIGADVKY